MVTGAVLSCKYERTQLPNIDRCASIECIQSFGMTSNNQLDLYWAQPISCYEI